MASDDPGAIRPRCSPHQRRPNKGLLPSAVSGSRPLCRAVQALGSGGALGRYAYIAEGPGFYREIAGVVIEVRLAGIAHEVLGDLAPDLLGLLRAYEVKLQRANLTDWAGILAIATEAAAQLSPGARRCLPLPTLLLDVPITSKAELAFIAGAALGRSRGRTSPVISVSLPPRWSEPDGPKPCLNV
jgi:hypothetical protein